MGRNGKREAARGFEVAFNIGKSDNGKSLSLFEDYA